MLVCRSYSVGGFYFQLSVDSSLLDRMENLSPFLYEVPSPSVSVLFHLREELIRTPLSEYRLLYRSSQGAAFPEIDIFETDKGYLFLLRPLPSCPVAAILCADRSFKEASISFTGVDDVFALNNATMLLYAFSAGTFGGLEVHASVVMCEGKGYLFLGKSGTGKSTHSRLWLRIIPGTALLNDDNPVLRLMPDGSARVFGSPWSGKTPCYKAQDVPVCAIVRIRQASGNSIVRMSLVESYASLMASVSAFRPFGHLADGWHTSIEQIVSSVPCYLLDCLPDHDAAILCYETVSGKDFAISKKPYTKDENQ